jgi:ubiquinone/menaquinone biosynthesis C-methylase UbiE
VPGGSARLAVAMAPRTGRLADLTPPNESIDELHEASPYATAPPPDSRLTTISSLAEIDPTEQTRQWSDSLASAWELYRDRLFEGQRVVSDWLVDQIDARPGQTVLELAAGPGETGFLVAERVGSAGKVISTDLGPQMVDAARRGAAARGITNIDCRVMDAQQIDLADSSVDAVLCRFGIMLMPQPAMALAGVRRVLRPDGRLAYAVWGAPDRNPWMTLLAMAIIQNGHQPAGDPFGPGGPFSLAAPDDNRALLTEAGFSDVRVEEIDGFMHFDDFDDFWDMQSQVSGPIALLISSLADDDVERLRTTLEPMLAPFRTDGGLDIPSLAIGLSAQ